MGGQGDVHGPCQPCHDLELSTQDEKCQRIVKLVADKYDENFNIQAWFGVFVENGSSSDVFSDELAQVVAAAPMLRGAIAVDVANNLVFPKAAKEHQHAAMVKELENAVALSYDNDPLRHSQESCTDF